MPSPSVVHHQLWESLMTERSLSIGSRHFATPVQIGLAAILAAALWQAPSTANAAAPAKLIYHGGPVISPIIVPIYWGTFTGLSDYSITTQQAYLLALADFMTGFGLMANFEPTVRQYGVWGASVHSPVLDTDPLPSVLNGTAVQGEINKLVQAGKVPYWGSPYLFILFTKGIPLGSGYGGTQYGCGWHYHNGSGLNAQYYAHVPYPESVCQPGSGQAGSTIWQEKASHEIFETATDPEANGWRASTNDEGADATGCNASYKLLPFGAVTYFIDNKGSTSSVVCNAQTKEQYTPLTAVIRTYPTIDVFYQGTDHALWSKRFNGTSWEAARSLGGSLGGTPTAVRFSSDELHVITTQTRTPGVSYTDRSLYDMVWTTAGGWASTFTSMDPYGVPFLLGNPSAVADGRVRIDVAAPSSWTSFYQLYYQNGVWNGLFSGGNGAMGYSATAPPTGVPFYQLTAPPAVLWSNQAGGTNYSVPDFNSPPTYPYSGAWTFSVAGGVSFAPMGAANRGEEIIDAVAVGTDNNLYFSNSPGFGAWNNWMGLGLGTVVGAPSVISWDSKHRTDVFAVDTNSALRHAYSSQDGTNWSTQNLDNGPDYGTPVVVSWEEYRLDVFIKGWDQHLWHFWTNNGVNWASEGFADTFIN
jgi:hypothetical protein